VFPHVEASLRRNASASGGLPDDGAAGPSLHSSLAGPGSLVLACPSLPAYDDPLVARLIRS